MQLIAAFLGGAKLKLQPIMKMMKKTFRSLPLSYSLLCDRLLVTFLLMFLIVLHPRRLPLRRLCLQHLLFPLHLLMLQLMFPSLPPQFLCLVVSPLHLYLRLSLFLLWMLQWIFLCLPLLFLCPNLLILPWLPQMISLILR